MHLQMRVTLQGKPASGFAQLTADSATVLAKVSTFADTDLACERGRMRGVRRARVSRRVESKMRKTLVFGCKK